MPAKWSSWDSYPRWTPNTITMPCCLQLQWNQLTVLIKSLSPAGGGNGIPLQYSCLGNPSDRGAWRATVHRVTKSWTWLKWLSMAWLTTIAIKLWTDYQEKMCGALLLHHVQRFVTPWTAAHQAPLSMGILQARTLEWVAMPSSRRFS